MVEDALELGPFGSISIHLEHRPQHRQAAVSSLPKDLTSVQAPSPFQQQCDLERQVSKGSWSANGRQMDANGKLEENAQQLFGLLNLALVLRQNITLFPEASPLLLDDQV